MTSGTVRFTIGDTSRDLQAGEYVVVPTGEYHTFENASDQPAIIFNTFTPAYYVNYFRELGSLASSEKTTPEASNSVRERYATVSR